jgi:K+ transporter
MTAWRKRLFVWMARATANRTEDLSLPPERTVVIGARVDL